VSSDYLGWTRPVGAGRGPVARHSATVSDSACRPDRSPMPTTTPFPILGWGAPLRSAETEGRAQPGKQYAPLVGAQV
jgi:hypothetical protein